MGLSCGDGYSASTGASASGKVLARTRLPIDNVAEMGVHGMRTKQRRETRQNARPYIYIYIYVGHAKRHTYPIPNSSRFVLPAVIAPARSSLSTTVAAYGDVKLSSIRDPQVVGASRVAMLSLTAMSRPSMDDFGDPGACGISIVDLHSSTSRYGELAS